VGELGEEPEDVDVEEELPEPPLLALPPLLSPPLGAAEPPLDSPPPDRGSAEPAGVPPGRWAQAVGADSANAVAIATTAKF
jgi:hypothetical protein